MTVDTAALHMVRLRFDVRRLLTRARLDRLPLHEVDLGYLVHSALVSLFGDKRPTSFALRGTKGRCLEVIGYAGFDTEVLREHAARCMDVAVRDACAWEDVAAKPMPTAWMPGSCFAFEVRACPVVRMAKEGPTHRKGAEVDAFLARCWAAGRDVAVDREGVYAEWLRGQVQRQEAATVLHVKLAAFRRNRLLRRTQGESRTAHMCERPDALFAGVLQVGNPAAFASLLARGIGRHRGFGFGMLLLRPAGSIGEGSC